MVNTRNPSKSRRCVPSWRSCVGGRECALEKEEEEEVIQRDRDGSTALGSLELLMRPPSSLSLLSFPSSLLSSNPSLGLGPPLLSLFAFIQPRHSASSRRAAPCTLALSTAAASLFQRTFRNVIAQLREFLPRAYFFLLSPPRNETFPRFLPRKLTSVSKPRNLLISDLVTTFRPSHYVIA